MTQNNGNKIAFKKAKDNRSPFLLIDIEICDMLSPYALKVYTQLRKLVDFREKHDEVQITIEILSIKSGISERKIYHILNELENEHFLIKRLTSNPLKQSNRNSYDVAQTYKFFSKNCTDKDFIMPAPNADQPACRADYPAPNADQPAPGAVPYMYQQSFQQSFQHVCGEASASTQHTTINSNKKQTDMEGRAFECEEVHNLFKSKFGARKVTLDQLFEDCKNHYEQKGTWVTKKKLMQWVQRENPDNYEKIGSHAEARKNSTMFFNDDEIKLMQEAMHAKRMAAMGQDINLFITLEKLAEAEKLLEKARMIENSSCKVQETSLRRENTITAADSLATMLKSLQRQSC